MGRVCLNHHIAPGRVRRRHGCEQMAGEQMAGMMVCPRILGIRRPYASYPSM